MGLALIYALMQEKRIEDVSKQAVEHIEKLNDSAAWVKLNGNENNLTSGTYRLGFTNQNDKVVYVSITF